MPYDEARYLSHDVISFTPNGGTQTYTASTHVLTQTVGMIPFAEAGWLVAGASSVQVAGVATGYVLNLLNGANVIATSTINAAANTFNPLTITTASSIIATATGLTVAVIGTGTASAAQINPIFHLQLCVRKQFV